MKHFHDWEFLEDGETVVPISVGIVSDDGAEYYAVFSEIQTDPDLHRRISEHDFLAKNVIKHLPLTDDRAVAEQLKVALGSKSDPFYGSRQASYDEPRRLEWQLDLTSTDVKPRWVIRNEIQKYFLDRLDHGLYDDTQDDEGDVELWANFGAYDHLCLAQLSGPMIKMPSHLPKFTHDIQQLRRSLGVSYKDMPKQEAAQHDALADARHDREMWLYLDRVRDDLAQQRGY